MPTSTVFEESCLSSFIACPKERHSSSLHGFYHSVNTGLALVYHDCCSWLTATADHAAISTGGSTVQLPDTNPLPSLLRMRKSQNPENYDIPWKDSKWCQGQGNTPDLQNNCKSIGKNAQMISTIRQSAPCDNWYFLRENVMKIIIQWKKRHSNTCIDQREKFSPTCIAGKFLA